MFCQGTCRRGDELIGLGEEIWYTDSALVGLEEMVYWLNEVRRESDSVLVGL